MTKKKLNYYHQWFYYSPITPPPDWPRGHPIHLPPLSALRRPHWAHMSPWLSPQYFQHCPVNFGTKFLVVPKLNMKFTHCLLTDLWVLELKFWSSGTSCLWNPLLSHCLRGSATADLVVPQLTGHFSNFNPNYSIERLATLNTFWTFPSHLTTLKYTSHTPANIWFPRLTKNWDSDFGSKLRPRETHTWLNHAKIAFYHFLCKPMTPIWCIKDI